MMGSIYDKQRTTRQHMSDINRFQVAGVAHGMSIRNQLAQHRERSERRLQRLVRLSNSPKVKRAILINRIRETFGLKNESYRMINGFIKKLLLSMKAYQTDIEDTQKIEQSSQIDVDKLNFIDYHDVLEVENNFIGE